MSGIGAADVKKLRERTQAGMMDCKRALEEASGDMDRAVEILRLKGQAKAARRGERAAGQGVVASYVHATGKIGVLAEVNCETDFVARNDEFLEFAREVALHIAAAGPRCVSAADVPDEDRDRERALLMAQADESKPEAIRAKIVEGRLEKWMEEIVLLEQEHVNRDKHGGATIEALRSRISAKTGENIVISRFCRFEVGAE